MLQLKMCFKLLMDRHLIKTPFCAVKDKQIHTLLCSHTLTDGLSHHLLFSSTKKSSVLVQRKVQKLLL